MDTMLLLDNIKAGLSEKHIFMDTCYNRLTELILKGYQFMYFN